jgi:hypothetical protein
MPPHEKHHPHDGPHHHHPDQREGPHHGEDHPPHHHHGPHHPVHHYLAGDLGVLDELSRRKRDATTATLIRLAQELEIPEVIQHLHRILDEYGDIRAGKALRMTNDHFAAKAEQRVERLIESDSEIGLVFPLPPHLHEPFVARGNVNIYVPGGHHVPHPLRRCGAPLFEGTRACRHAIVNSAVVAIIFEMHRVDGRRLVDPDVADLLSAVAGVRPIELWAQLRPHAHRDDIEFDMVGNVAFI